MFLTILLVVVVAVKMNRCCDVMKKVMKEMRNKKSAGHDNISQECLLMGKKVLAVPLTRIINTSIRTGTLFTSV